MNMDMQLTELRQQIKEAVDVIRTKTQSTAEIGIILGSGLGELVKEIHIETEISFTDIPHFPVSTVEFHAGKLIFGKIADIKTVTMQGRFHYYEGYSMKQITFPVRVMKELGVKILIVSNACGGINASMKPGDIMVITDHINLLGDNPLIGMNDDTLGPRFPDMSEPYNQELIRIADEVSKDFNGTLHHGVYAAMSGPSLETAAEYKFLRTIGADAIGMSTIPETIVAVHCGIKVLGFSVITDSCIPETLKPVNVAEIIRVAKQAEPKLKLLIKNVIQYLGRNSMVGGNAGDV
ncbi:purine-nucleoside phosphorylase [candidate division KSB1 bacterium]|nr:purine-nucleoside phosphorylase [candidate division KSB1 bacterium]